MRRVSVRLTFAATFVCSAWLMVAGPALARSVPSPGAAPQGRAASLAGSPAASPGIVAGYWAVPDNGVASSSVAVTVPTITCPQNGRSYLQDTLYNQAGYQVASAQMYLYCKEGTPYYYVYAWTYQAKFNSGLLVNPGDHLRLSVFDTPTDMVADVLDKTSGQDSYQHDGVPNASGSPTVSAYPGDYTSLGEPIADFGRIFVHDVEVNGMPLWAVPAYKLKMQTGSDIQVTASQIFRQSAFLLKWHNAS